MPDGDPTRPFPREVAAWWNADLVCAALHALADMIEAGESARQLDEFEPDELREHARLLQAESVPRATTAAAARSMTAAHDTPLDDCLSGDDHRQDSLER